MIESRKVGRTPLEPGLSKVSSVQTFRGFVSKGAMFSVGFRTCFQALRSCFEACLRRFQRVSRPFLSGFESVSKRPRHEDRELIVPVRLDLPFGGQDRGQEYALRAVDRLGS